MRVAASSMTDHTLRLRNRDSRAPLFSRGEHPSHKKQAPALEVL